VATLFIWGRLPPQHLARQTHGQFADQDLELLSFSEGLDETIVVTQRRSDRARQLHTNGFTMSATVNKAQRYMRAFAHIPLLSMAAPRRVLVICFGVGNTLHAASLHPSVERLEVADLSRHVLKQAHFFSRWNRGILRDPRVRVFINDGRQHLRMRPADHYDLVTLEPPPITHAGVSALYSREFYALARGRLRPGGHLTQWLPVYQVPAQITASMVQAFIDVFPDGVLLSGHRSELILLGRKGGPPTIDPAVLARRLAARPRVRDDLARIDLASTVELIGSFAGSSAALRRTAGDAAAVTDDLPLMEYDTRSRQRSIPATLFDPGSVKRWCPGCFAAGDGRPVPLVADLETYLGFMRALYRDPIFLLDRIHRQHPTPALIRAPQGSLARTYAASRYLQEQFLAP
jgi:spermidine synthase